MVDLGKDFKAPRRRNAKQWRKVELLVAAGLTFDSCGCNGPGPRPRTLADAKAQLGGQRIPFGEAVELIRERYAEALRRLAKT